MEKLKGIYFIGLIVFIILHMIDTVIQSYFIPSIDSGKTFILLTFPFFAIYGVCGYCSYRVNQKLSSSIAMGFMLGFSGTLFDFFVILRMWNLNRLLSDLDLIKVYTFLVSWSALSACFLGGLISKKIMSL